jgi:hypothetical protein
MGLLETYSDFETNIFAQCLAAAQPHYSHPDWWRQDWAFVHSRRWAVIGGDCVDRPTEYRALMNIAWEAEQAYTLREIERRLRSDE